MCDRLQESLQRERQEADAKIEAIEQLRHADRLRTVGQLASGVAHELGTPLNVVTGRASMISSGRLSPTEISDNAEIIKTQAERMASIIRKLLDFSRSGNARRTQVDLRIIVSETARILQHLSQKQGVQLVVAECPDPMMADVDAGQIQQVLTNVVVNGIQATPAGGRVTVRLTKVANPPKPESITLEAGADYFCLSVEDTGAGIAKEVRDRLFEPFVTTKEIGQGTGLGLSIAYGIVNEHHGWIDVHSEPGFGSRFRIYLTSRSQS
jgi:signal transduction histidine kinase